MDHTHKCELCLNAITVPRHIERWYFRQLFPYANMSYGTKLSKKQIEMIILFKTSSRFRYFMNRSIAKGKITNSLMLKEIQTFRNSNYESSAFVSLSFLAEKNRSYQTQDQLNCTMCSKTFCRFHSKFLSHFRCKSCNSFVSLCTECHVKNCDCVIDKKCDTCNLINSSDEEIIKEIFEDIDYDDLFRHENDVALMDLINGSI